MIESKLVEILSLILKDEKHSKDWCLQLAKLELEAKNIKEVEQLLPEGWVPLRIACSALLTQRTNLKFVTFPQSIESWFEIWEEIKPTDNNKKQLSHFFMKWLKSRGNHRFAEKFGIYYESYWSSRNWDLNESLKDLSVLRSLQTTDEVKKWWMKFDGIGSQYAKNLPMDEKDERFLNYVKIDYRLSKIADNIGCNSLSNEEKQNVFLKVANELNMSGWELDRFCFFFYPTIIEQFV